MPASKYVKLRFHDNNLGRESHFRLNLLLKKGMKQCPSFQCDYLIRALFGLLRLWDSAANQKSREYDFNLTLTVRYNYVLTADNRNDPNSRVNANSSTEIFPPIFRCDSQPSVSMSCVRSLTKMTLKTHK